MKRLVYAGKSNVSDITVRAAQRSDLANQVEEFLRNGGTIKKLASGDGTFKQYKPVRANDANLNIKIG